MEILKRILEAVGIPFAYDHFAEGENPVLPFIIFKATGTDNFSADGKVYKVFNEWRIELYTEKKNRNMERLLETKLEDENIFWDKSESYIYSEKMYQISYSFVMED